MSTTSLIEVPRIPVGDRIQDFFDWLTTNMAGFFDAISTFIESAVDRLINLLEAPDPVLMAVIFAVIGLLVRGWKFAVLALRGCCS